MTDSKTDQVRSFFHGYAESFDGIYMQTKKRGAITKLIDHLFRKSMYLRFKRTLKELQNPSINTVLDVGCGPGRYCVDYVKMGKDVTGVDLAQGMLQIARQLCETETPKGKFKCIQGDYMQMEFPQKFDAAVLMGLFDYIEDPVTMLKKLKKETRHMIVGSFPKAGGLLAFQRKIRYKIRSCPLYFYSRADLERILKQADLNEFTIDETDREFYLKVTLDA